MPRFAKKALVRIAQSAGVGLTSDNRLQELLAAERDIDNIFSLIAKSVGCDSRTSQLGQDVFTLLETGFKRNGYFVEFGATNGVNLSNTYMLETCFGWGGILAEPAPVWHDALVRNRNVKIDFDCVWSRTGETLDFRVTCDPELSTVSGFKPEDHHSKSRITYNTVNVNTVSLNDLLKRHGAPRSIDYLSIDTEGTEFEILKYVDFDHYSFSVITCEHNYTSNREKIHTLLTSKGYVRKFEGVSKFDDWYVKTGADSGGADIRSAG